MTFNDKEAFVDIAKVPKSAETTININTGLPAKKYMSEEMSRPGDGKTIKDKVTIYNEELRQKLILKRRLRRIGQQHRSKQTASRGHHTKASSPIASVTESETKEDVYAQSLITTNRLFNQLYGFKQRKVIGHVGFLLNIDILTEMLTTYADQFRQTRRNRFRHSADMQFAFSYFHHLMEQQMERTTSDIFDEFDTDMSGSWSDREIRTLLSQMYSLPLSWTSIQHFERIVSNCSGLYTATSSGAKVHNQIPFPTLHYERYLDSNIVSISSTLLGLFDTSNIQCFQFVVDFLQLTFC